MPTFHLADFYDTPRATNDMASFAGARPHPVVRITLNSNRTIDRRTLTLRPGEVVVIGRSSRSEQKNLSAANDNALFDCPVVSRVHAELRASGLSASKEVIITDRSSLHGTTVNGQRLTPGHNFTLKSGDVIKLGDRVTRGEGMSDTHEGVSLTFSRDDDMLSNLLSDRATGPNTFHVPSVADEEASDYDSEAESIRSYSMGHSSAKTTPEHPKKTIIGDVIDLSQEDDEDDEYEPAAVPDSLASKSTQNPIVIDDSIDDEEIVVETAHEQQHPLAFLDVESEDDEGGMATNTGLAEILRERDVVRLDDEAQDEDVDDEAIAYEADVADMHSDSASDVSETSDMNNAIAETHLPVNSSYGFARAAPLMAAKPRYDPVRNSQPPTGESNISNNAQAHKPMDYSYNFGTMGAASDMATTSFASNSRWDVPTATVTPPTAQYTDPVYGGWQNSNTQFSFGLGAWQQYPPRLPSQPSYPVHPVEKPLAASSSSARSDKPPPTQPEAPPALEPSAVPEPTGKISITQLLEEQDDAPQPADDPAVEANSTANAVPATSGTKRKAAEVEDEIEASEPSTKKAKPAVVVPAITSRVQRRRPRGRGTVRRIAQGAAAYGASAVFGAAATVAFLSSPYAQNLIDWLS